MKSEIYEDNFHVTVSGDSMSPQFLDGDILEIDSKIYEYTDPQKDDIILFEHPYIKDFLMLKKIIFIEDGKYHVEGINKSESTDSRSFGKISRDKIIGKVVSKVGKKQD